MNMHNSLCDHALVNCIIPTKISKRKAVYKSARSFRYLNFKYKEDLLNANFKEIFKITNITEAVTCWNKTFLDANKLSLT